MTRHRALVPSAAYPSGLDALAALADGAIRIRGAIAFVTATGAELLGSLIAANGNLQVDLVARGAPITEPAALDRLDELGVAVSVVVGTRATRFHPKLWLVDHADGMRVLAGSGNLTRGGMRDNDEQFEELDIASGDHASLGAHEQRFGRFAEFATDLGVVRGTPYWNAWQKQLERRRELEEQERELDDELMRAADASLAVEALYADLVALYEQTKSEVRIAAHGGGTRAYVASYFKRAIDQSRGASGPVPVVARMVKAPTEGFNHLAEAERPDLMVETLVVDAAKPYHHLFSATTVAQAQASLDAYHANRGSR